MLERCPQRLTPRLELQRRDAPQDSASAWALILAVAFGVGFWLLGRGSNGDALPLSPEGDSPRAEKIMGTNGTTETKALALAQPATVQHQLSFNAEQRQMIRDTFANGASEEEFAVLIEISRARNLNPLLRQIHFVQRWDNQKNRMVWSTQVSIDGLRAIAQRTGLYDGQDEAEFMANTGPTTILCAKVRVYRKDWARPAVGIAYWDEYVQKTKDGKVTRMWAQMPHVMIAKCAEANAIRRAFPEDTSGLYVPEEMQQAENVTATAEPPHDAATGEVKLGATQSAIDEYRKCIAEANLEALAAMAGDLAKEPAAIRQALRSEYSARKKALTEESAS